jgi:hypothetical protein
MPSLHITKSAVDAIAPERRTVIYYDRDLAGFGVRVAHSGRKSWIVEYRPDGGGRGVSSRRMTLGTTRALAVDEAADWPKGFLPAPFSARIPPGTRKKRANCLR